MCGIAGIFDFAGGQIDRAELEAMRLALNHRGPDGSECVALGHAGLVHTRLSILDLSPAAHQPMWDTDRRVCLAYNGEIYNFQEIRQRLAQQGVRFRSTGDTEVLLMACLTYGVEKTLPLLNGMFAFALWDSRTGEVWLARDRTGIKPLYYTMRRGQLLFASEIRALLAIAGSPRADISVLLNLLHGGTPTVPYTPFAGVYGLRAGHYARLARGETELVQRPYHRLPEDIDPERYGEYARMSGDEVARHFSQLVQNSVDIHSISDAPVAALVSGGLDSALIASHAKRRCPGIVFYHADVVGRHSEVDAAGVVSRHLGAPLKVARMHAADYVRELVRTVYYHEMPSAYHPNDVPFQLVARMARADGIKVFLTGEGADELFVGYGEMAWRFLQDRLLNSPLARLPVMRKIAQRLSQSLTGHGSFMEHVSTRGISHDILHEAENAYSFITNGPERRAKARSLHYMHTHLNSLLMRNDRMGMMHSLESRIPFLENEILRFALNLPMKHLFPHRLHHLVKTNPLTRNKSVVRNAARDLLPPEIVYRKKQGFMVTPLEYIRPHPGFYRDGFLVSLLGHSEADLNHTLETLPAERQWNFFATEVFGRLFFMGEAIASLEEQVQTCAGTLQQNTAN